MFGQPITPAVAVIVDGYSTGKYLPAAFRERGLPSVHVRTSETIGGADAHSHDADYLEVVVHDSDIDVTLNALAKYNVLCVTPGIEGAGVALADALARRLGVTGNDPATSDRRQNKAAMQAALAEAGVTHIPFREASTPTQLTAACIELGEWPLVVKPLNSADTQDVIICENDNHAQAALAIIIGKVNDNEQLNESALVETFVDGVEYVVNTVSLDGRHLITDMWVYDKRVVLGSTRVCLRVRLLPTDGDVQRLLAEYIGPALDALGLQNGAAHSEVFITDQGPVLGETGARLMGGALDPAIFSEALTYTQLDALTDSLVAPDRFIEHLSDRIETQCAVEIVNFMMDRSGVVVAIPGLDAIRALPSYRDLIMAVKVGDTVVPTVDGLTCPGHIILSSTNAEQVERDYEEIRRIEPSLFELA